MKGEFVIIRARDAGVHAGTLVSHEGRIVELKDSRRLSRFFCAKGDSLSAVALYGIDPTRGRIEGVVPQIKILDACEIISTSAEAQKTIEDAPEYMPS